jgi:hypothetical protein
VCRHLSWAIALDFFTREEEYPMKKVEQPKEVKQPQSKFLRIGIVVASLIVGVILALFTILSPP